jgi:hypothetical protein
MVIGNQLDISLIPRMAKHKVVFDVFPATTLRYLDDRVTLALLLRTQEATILLPCTPRPASQPPTTTPITDPLPLPTAPPATARGKGRPRLTEQERLLRLRPPARRTSNSGASISSTSNSLSSRPSSSGSASSSSFDMDLTIAERVALRHQNRPL